MKTIRRKAQSICIFFTILMLLISTPYQSAFAVLIGTETILEKNRVQETRDYLKKALAREEVNKALLAQGINPLEAKARIECLSDAEITLIADQIEQLPAGGDAVILLLVVIPLIAFVVLVILDSLGYTDVLPFIEPQK